MRKYPEKYLEVLKNEVNIIEAEGSWLMDLENLD